MSITDPVLREAAGLDPSLGAGLAAGDIFKLPTFTTNYESKVFPALNGEVVIRYQTVGDALKIERIMGRGAGLIAEVVATLTVLIERAPASWYRVIDGRPALDLESHPDLEGLAALYGAFTTWRSDFRG